MSSSSPSPLPAREVQAALPATRDPSVRTEQLGNLEAEVLGHLPVLPVLRQQLGETAQQVEAAVVSVCGSFQNIAKRALEAAEQGAPRAEEEQTRAEFERMLENSHETLEALLARLIRGSELSMNAVYRMEDLQGDMQRIIDILKEVDEIATGTRVLAVNAKIEAVRVGEQGRGFAVVADEISKLSRQSARISESIQTIVGQVAGGVVDTVKDLRELASADMNSVLLSKTEVEQTLETMRGENGKMQASLDRNRDMSRALANDIGRAVIALQFQDRVSQRLQHVSQAIEEMESSFGAATRSLQVARPAQVQRHQQRIHEKLLASYTMAEERKATQTDTQPSNSSSVDLF